MFLRLAHAAGAGLQVDERVGGALPENDNVFGVALAGHGFKFAPVLGQILADLIQGIAPAIDVDLFSPRRFLDQDI